MIKHYIEEANFQDTGFSYTLSLISGKYKMVILYCLMEYETVRFNELRRYLKNISDKTLSANLKELEADRLPKLMANKYGTVKDGTDALGGIEQAKGTFYNFQRSLYRAV